jgi:hypothetical protein
MKNGKIIEVGNQNIADGTISIKDGERIVQCRLWQDCGDINFMYEGEEVFFRDL